MASIGWDDWRLAVVESTDEFVADQFNRVEKIVQFECFSLWREGVFATCLPNQRTLFRLARMSAAWVARLRQAGGVGTVNSLRRRVFTASTIAGRACECVFMRYVLADGGFDYVPEVAPRRSRLKLADIIASCAFVAIACGVGGYMVGGFGDDDVAVVAALPSTAPVSTPMTPAVTPEASPWGLLSPSARALRWTPNRIAAIDPPAPRANALKQSPVVVADAASPVAQAAVTPAPAAVPLPEPRPAPAFRSAYADVPLPPANPFRNQRQAVAAAATPVHIASAAPAPVPAPAPAVIAPAAPKPEKPAVFVAPVAPVAQIVAPEAKATPVPPAPASVARPEPVPAQTAAVAPEPAKRKSVRRGSVVAAAAANKPDDRSFFEKLFSAPQPEAGQALAYARPDDGVTRVPASPGNAAPSAGAGVAVYDIEAHVVYLPNGEQLEAHSGLGPLKDDPSHVHVAMRGATPPHVYDLTLREKVFHGVRALRLTPSDGGGIYGRSGLLAHSFMLGPNGDSNGCVSFRDYNRFLQAYLRGEIRQLKVVARGASAPAQNWFASRT